VLLGLPFLSHNNIVVDHSARTAIDKTMEFDLLNPTKFKTMDKSLITMKQNVLTELKSIFRNKKQLHSIISGMAMAYTIDAQQPSADVIKNLADLVNNIICDNQDIFI
jgi:hypothetical protein